jgi:hypothetical protein
LLLPGTFTPGSGFGLPPFIKLKNSVAFIPSSCHTSIPPINYLPPMKLQSYLSKFAEGPWSGPEVSLEISIADYGIAWCQHSPGEERFHPGEIRFAVLYYYPGGPVLDWGDFSKDMDIYREFDWVRPADWESLYCENGISKSDFDALPMEYKIQILLCRYGAEEIFGTPYMGDFIDPASYLVSHGGTCQEFETREAAEDFARSLPPREFESLERQDWLSGKDTTLNFSTVTGESLKKTVV